MNFIKKWKRRRELKKKAKEIEDLLNNAARKMNEEAGFPLFELEAKVIFMEDNE